MRDEGDEQKNFSGGKKQIRKMSEKKPEESRNTTVNTWIGILKKERKIENNISLVFVRTKI
jgi:hypothetical protein